MRKHKSGATFLVIRSSPNDFLRGGKPTSNTLRSPYEIAAPDHAALFIKMTQAATIHVSCQLAGTNSRTSQATSMSTDEHTTSEQSHFLVSQQWPGKTL